MLPRGNLSSTNYALVNTAAVGGAFLVYAPNGGTFSLNLSSTTRPLSVEWFNPATGVKTAAGTVQGGSSRFVVIGQQKRACAAGCDWPSAR